MVKVHLVTYVVSTQTKYHIRMSIVLKPPTKVVVARQALPAAASSTATNATGGLVSLGASPASVTIPTVQTAGPTGALSSSSITANPSISVSGVGFAIQEFEDIKLVLTGDQLAQLHALQAPTAGNASCLTFDAEDSKGFKYPIALGLAQTPVEFMTKKQKKRLGHNSDSDSDDDGGVVVASASGKAPAEAADEPQPGDLVFILPVPANAICEFACLDPEEVPSAKFRDADSRFLSATNTGSNEVYFSEGLAPDSQRGFYIRVKNASQFGDNVDDKATIEGLKGFCVRPVQVSPYSPAASAGGSTAL